MHFLSFYFVTLFEFRHENCRTGSGAAVFYQICPIVRQTFWVRASAVHQVTHERLAVVRQFFRPPLEEYFQILREKQME